MCGRVLCSIKKIFSKIKRQKNCRETEINKKKRENDVVLGIVVINDMTTTTLLSVFFMSIKRAYTHLSATKS